MMMGPVPSAPLNMLPTILLSIRLGSNSHVSQTRSNAQHSDFSFQGFPRPHFHGNKTGKDSQMHQFCFLLQLLNMLPYLLTFSHTLVYTHTRVVLQFFLLTHSCVHFTYLHSHKDFQNMYIKIIEGRIGRGKGVEK